MLATELYHMVLQYWCRGLLAWMVQYCNLYILNQQVMEKQRLGSLLPPLHKEETSKQGLNYGGISIHRSLSGLHFTQAIFSWYAMNGPQACHGSSEHRGWKNHRRTLPGSAASISGCHHLGEGKISQNHLRSQQSTSCLIGLLATAPPQHSHFVVPPTMMSPSVISMP